jgi:hypothetical protein
LAKKIIASAADIFASRRSSHDPYALLIWKHVCNVIFGQAMSISAIKKFSLRLSPTRLNVTIERNWTMVQLDALIMRRSGGNNSPIDQTDHKFESCVSKGRDFATLRQDRCHIRHKQTDALSDNSG